MSTDYAALALSGLSALARGDAAGARTALASVEAAGQGSTELRLRLAQACVLVGDSAQANTALDKVLAADRGNLLALILRGDLLTQQGDLRAAVSWYQAALTHAPRLGPLSNEVQLELARARVAVDGAGAAFEKHLRDRLAAAGVRDEDMGRLGEALAILTGRAEVQVQRPTNFYFPGLAPRPFFEREQFSWAPAVEAAAPAIRAELTAVLSDASALAPYVSPEANRPAKRHALLNDSRWSAFHLFRNGAPVAEAASRCPATFAALSHAPLPRVDGRSPMALFSVLRPKTHIPPHWGMLNTRLICHLPLIVPENCRLRVGNQTRSVVADRLMIFDDSLEHEAWNDSDETRAVLLFEIWRPDITGEERRGLTAIFESIAGFKTAEDQGGA